VALHPRQMEGAAAKLQRRRMGPTPSTDSPSPQPTSVPSWRGQRKGMGGDRGRRMVEAYHHQLLVPGVVLQHHCQSKGNGEAVEVKFTIT